MKKLRKKIILGVFLSATVVFALTILATAITMNIGITRNIDSMTKLMIQYQGVLPEMDEFKAHEHDFRVYNYNEESPYRLRYFSVTYSSDGTVKSDVTHVKSVDENEAIMMADDVLLKGNEYGSFANYRYRISDDRSLVVFIDGSGEYTPIEWFIFFLIIIAFGFIIMITVVFWFLSSRIVKPFEDNNRMQKQFITDASHELKTPLAIISANAEVLAYKNGENEWIKNITAQVSRVSGLVNELLTLNRLEEIDEITDISQIDMSALITEISATFEEVFNSRSAELSREIEPNVLLNGNRAQLERLVSVLVENASKYVSDNGKVIITLHKGTRYTEFSVFNTCEIDKDVDYAHLFDRFYRPDSSRASSTGGHGIGLSIAKRITVLHGGSIEAVPSDGGLSFNVKLSNKLKAGKQKGRKT